MPARSTPAPETQIAPPEGHVRLAAPPDAVTCQVDGTTYAVEDGAVVVPAEAAARLAPLGFRAPDA